MPVKRNSLGEPVEEPTIAPDQPYAWQSDDKTDFVSDPTLPSDPDGVAELFANNPEGIAFRLEDLAATLLQAGGLFDGREQSLGAQIDDIGDRRLNLEFRLVQKEATLVAQFSALDTLIAQLSTTSSFLTIQLEQIAAITNFSFNNNRR